MNPEAHNIKFMGERVPFEGQTLGSSLSEPDVAGEQAAIDANFGNRDMTPQDKLMSEIMDKKGNLKPDSQFMDHDDMHDEALADWEARQSDIDFARKEGNTEGFEGKPYHEIEQEELNADKERFYAKFPHLKPQEDDRPPHRRRGRLTKGSVVKKLARRASQAPARRAGAGAAAPRPPPRAMRQRAATLGSERGGSGLKESEARSPLGQKA